VNSLSLMNLKESREKMNYVCIDVETARHSKESLCSIGLCIVENGKIVDEYYKLIKPPGNKYHYIHTKIHGLSASDTKDSPTFKEAWHEIEPLLKGNVLIAHNVNFDKSCLKATMEYYGINYNNLGVEHKWKCSWKLAKVKGYFPANLKALSKRFGISTEGHHNASCDARMCAKIYMAMTKR